MKNYKNILKLLFMFVSLFIVYQTFILHISGSKIPDFSYKNINNKIVRVSSLPRLKTLIVFFSTDCDYCTDAISEIKKISIKRKDVNYLFVTEEKDLTSVSTFVKKNKLNEITPYILIDYNKNFQKDFGLGFSMSIPTILHYDKNGNFVKEIIDYDELKTI